jgi:Ethanolamine utilization protein EutJ (predicted chaperonin)
MNKKLIRLTESDLHRIVKESVKRVLKEDDTQNLGINNYDPTNYDELNMKIKAIMSKVSEIRNMIEDISTSQLDVAQNAGNLDGLAEELYRQLRYTLHKANTSNYIEA